MKTRRLPLSSLFLTFLTFLIVLSAEAQVPSYVPTNGLVGYWPFNGNANDESGNGNNGTVNGATPAVDRNNNVNSAYSFDGVDDWIDFNLQNIDMSYSLTFWLYSTSINEEMNFLELFMSSYCQPIPQNKIFYNQGSTTGNTSVSSNYSYVTGTWCNVLFSYDGVNNLQSIYINGELDSVKTVTGTMSSLNSLLLAKRPNNTGYYFGKLDDIGIWDRALTQEEVLNLYNSCIPSLYYSDIDGDGFGAGDALNTCNPPVGYVLNNTDCNDDNANQNEGVSEVCNNQDDNCNSSIDEGLTFQNYYLDSDGDGFGTGAANSSCIALGVGYITNDTDCDDSNASVNPNAEEIGANGIDENCDGQIDNSVEEFSTVISLFPNPATTELNLQITSDLIGTDLFVFDALGKQILKQQILSTNTIINTSSFAAGNYVVKVGGGVKKFTVEK
jgi:hypothetical protein